jgi:hypothetical protein
MNKIIKYLEELSKTKTMYDEFEDLNGLHLYDATGGNFLDVFELGEEAGRVDLATSLLRMFKEGEE